MTTPHLATIMLKDAGVILPEIVLIAHSTGRELKEKCSSRTADFGWLSC